MRGARKIKEYSTELERKEKGTMTYRKEEGKSTVEVLYTVLLNK